MALKNIFCTILIILVMIQCQSGPQLFHQLSEQETGIDFANAITDSEVVNAMTFEYIYNGAGVAAADFNNDGLTDLYFTGNQVSNRLYLNKGKLRFEDITRTAKVQTTKVWCTGVTVVDINQDGWQDIYVCVAGFVKDSTLRTNLLFENQGLDKNGNPVFEEKAAIYGLDDTGYSTQAAFFDYDRDGDLDCYVLTNALEKENRNALRPKRTDGEAPGNDRLYRNDGQKYTDVSRLAGILTEGYGLGLAISDLNGDGWEDIYCANDFLSNDLVWLNNQNGTFTNRAAECLKHQSHNGMGVDIADINHDTRPDIMVLDMLPEDNERQKMMLAGSNHDRMALDLKLGYQPQYMRNTLQINYAAKAEEDSTSLQNFRGVDIAFLAGVSKTDWSWAPLFADYDNDGNQDLLITNGYRRDVTNMDFMAYLVSQREMQMFNNNENNDGSIYKKIKELPEIKLANYAYRNKGNMTFENVTKEWGINTPSYSNGAVYADFDNDGDLDYVVNNIDDKAFFYENTSNLTTPQNNWLRLRLKGKSGNRDAIGSKIKIYAGRQCHYRELNPTRGYVSAVELTQHVGLGTHHKIDSLVIFWPNGTYQTEKEVKINQLFTLTYDRNRVKPFQNIFSGTIEEQDFTELDVKSLDLDFVHVENQYNDFDQTSVLPQKFSRVSPCIAVGDVNGDALDDIFFGTDVTHLSALYIQNPTGTFSKYYLPESDNFEDAAAAFFDADNDGDLDIYVVSGGSHAEGKSERHYQDRLYLNKGEGVFAWQKNALPVTSYSGSTVSIADFDKDGDMDILRGSRLISGEYPLPPDSYLFVNQSVRSKIKFEDKTKILAPNLANIGLVTASAWADLNNDNQLDLVLVGEWMPVTVLYQTNRKFKEAAPLVQGSEGWWQSLLAKDVDNDGDIDLLVGNVGLNTKYSASVQKPLRIYAKDFDSNGRLDPIMSFFLQEDEVPIPTRDLITSQIPGLKRYFSTYSAYAKANMRDILNKEDLESAFIRKIVELRTGWVENRGKGVFKFHPFEIQAQFSLVNSIVNLDNEYLLLGNSNAPETISGWWDAGVGTTLSFTKKGGVKIKPNNGMAADREVRSAGIVKRKNDKLVVIGNVDNGCQVFSRKK